MQEEKISNPIHRIRTREESRALAEQMYGPEWAEWIFMSQEDRLNASVKLMGEYLALGGHLAPEVDLQSPFWTMDDYRQFAKERKERKEKQEREAMEKRQGERKYSCEI